MNQDMEKALQEALRRQSPPPGFANRVMARLPQAESESDGYAGTEVRQMPTRRRPWLVIGLAASLVVGTFGGVRYQEYRQGQEAKRQLLLALQITGEKLTLAQHKVVGIGERRVDQ